MKIRIVSNIVASISVFTELVWTIPPIQITPGGSFDLAPTLPPAAPPGGLFALDAGTLPAGVTLAANGVISAAPNAVIGSESTDARFSYTVG